MQTNKAISRFGGRSKFEGAVVSVNQLELGLFRVTPERIATFEKLKTAHRQTKVLVFKVALSLPVQLLLA